MKITRAILQDRVERINKMLNRPATAYRKVENVGGKTYLPNDGHFKLDINSPGDGWTRYALAMMLESGGETNVSRTFNAQEMYAYLSGVMDVLETSYTHRFDDASQSIQKLVQSAKDLLAAKWGCNREKTSD